MLAAMQARRADFIATCIPALREGPAGDKAISDTMAPVSFQPDTGNMMPWVTPRDHPVPRIDVGSMSASRHL